jgi:streptomycin 6-kinase
MQTKLTLRLEDRLIRRAKSYAKRSGKSVSELVADLFSRLSSPEPAPPRDLTPVVKRLAGALAGRSLDKADYRRHLEDKYG